MRMELWKWNFYPWSSLKVLLPEQYHQHPQRCCLLFLVTTTSIITMGTIFEVLIMGWVFTSTLSWYYHDSHVRWFSFFIFYGKGNWGSKKVRKLPLVPWCVQKNLTLPKERCGFPDNSVGKESACNSGTPVWFLGQEDPLEKGKATHFSILAWRIPWTVWLHGFTKSGTRQSNFHVQGKMWSLPWVSER